MSNHLVPSYPDDSSEFLLYQTEDGQTRVQVRFAEETVWLSQGQMAELFQTTKQNISLHIRNVFEEGELEPGATVKQYLTVQNEGNRRVERSIEYYNLDVIISVGYRVRSHRGTQFRQWATQRLREYILKGFVLDDERLKEGRRLGNDYFDELLERIRDIRASERRFYQKITDIYATSVDYDPRHPLTCEFFATVQNKLHWAIHGQTAAELIVRRADASQPNMGLTAWKNGPGGRIRKADTESAKNYLTHEELSELNLIVDQYLSFAELQARQRKAMTMADWKSKLDAFLVLNDREILDHAGTITAELAKETAAREFDKYEAYRRSLEAECPTSDFDHFVEQVKKLPEAEREAK
jgi:hypothetical protein